jgi:hypothetical protein
VRRRRSWLLEGLEQRLMLAGPDLVVTAASAPANPKLGVPFTVSWTASNMGDAAATAGAWDGVYLSTDNQFNPEFDQWVGQAERPIATVNAGGSYQSSAEVEIGGSSLAPLYVLVVVDQFAEQAESNESNNVFAIAIQPVAPDVDLTITATAPATAQVGQSFNVSWTVTNAGTDRARGWEVDRVLLSDDATLDRDGTDQPVASFSSEGDPLAAGGSYTKNRSVALSSIGQKYLLFVVDYGQNQIETNETNNVIAKAIAISGPDLTVTAGSVTPTQARPGQSVNVSFTVKNVGNADADGAWSDAILLSRDDEFDGDEVFLTNVAAGGEGSVAPDGT